MNVETLIFAYIAICISMILFNTGCALVFTNSDRLLQNKGNKLKKRIEDQLLRLEEGKDVEESHKRYLAKKLTRVGNLMAFDDLIVLDMTLETLSEERRQAMEQYLHSLHGVFTLLALEYYDKDYLRLAYFAYLIGKHRIIQGFSLDLIMKIMLSLLNEKSLYCRENALYALYHSGDVDCVVQALQIIDKNQSFYHSKLLSDGLLSFTGNHHKLGQAFQQNFDRFTLSMQLVILNYFRFSSDEYCPMMLELLADTTRDDEIRIAAIRYFGKYHYAPAYPLLLNFAEAGASVRWEYPAITASALANYPSPRTIEALKQNLSNDNWYVRFNAAQSLDKFGLTYTELIDVIDGNDRYAREILQYFLDMRSAKTAETEESI